MNPSSGSIALLPLYRDFLVIHDPLARACHPASAFINCSTMPCGLITYRRRPSVGRRRQQSFIFTIDHTSCRCYFALLQGDPCSTSGVDYSITPVRTHSFLSSPDSPRSFEPFIYGVRRSPVRRVPHGRILQLALGLIDLSAAAVKRPVIGQSFKSPQGIFCSPPARTVARRT